LTSNKRLHFGGDLDYDANPAISKGIFYHCGTDAFARILLITKEKVVDEFL